MGGPLVKRAQLAWILYDVSSSGYVLLITAVTFPIYFKLHGTGGAAWSDALWGSLLATGSLLAAFLGPIVGTAADISGNRLRYLYAATLICSVSTVLLGLAGLPLAVLSAVFVVSFVAYLVAASLYDSLLNTVASPDSYAWLSGMGWGFGYVGGILCYLVSARFLAAGPNAADVSGFAATFLIVGIYYACVGGLAVALMSGRQRTEQAPAGLQVLQSTIEKLAERLRSWRTGGRLPRLLAGANLVTGAASALTLFAPLILSFHFGLPVQDVALLSALFSVLSIPSTLASGFALMRIPALLLLLAISPLWLIAAGLLAFGTGWHAGLAAAICLGLVVGPTNATARAIVANSIAEREAGEMFGFAAFVNRLTAAFGPLFFGVLSSASSGRLIPVAVAGAAIVAGLLLLPRGTRHSHPMPQEGSDTSGA
jgi:UMF1 family MFS transporter